MTAGCVAGAKNPKGKLFFRYDRHIRFNRKWPIRILQRLNDIRFRRKYHLAKEKNAERKLVHVIFAVRRILKWNESQRPISIHFQ
jgi:hypothetical protein